MMKLAMLGPAYPLRGGIARHTGILFRRLEERGHDVKLFSFRKQFPRFLFPGSTQLDSSEAADVVPAVPLFIPWNPLSWLKTARMIRAFSPEAIICIWWTPFNAMGYTAVCRLISGKASPSVLFLLHNVVPHEKMPAVKMLTRLAFRQAEGFIPQSQKVESEFLNFFPRGDSKWRRVVPHPTYDFRAVSTYTREGARSKLGISESRALLFFGIVRRYKGLMTLIEAFPAVLEHFGGDIKLIIAGEFYDPPEPYFSKIEESGISDKTMVHNRFIPNEEVGLYFAAADVAVLPYSSASQSGVTQAAFGFGIPVISTSVGGLPEVISHGQTGLLCPPDNPDELARAIIEFYRLSKDVDWAGNIEREKPRFSWDNLAEAVEDFTVQLNPKP